MTDAAAPDRPGFHLVDPSPWPLVVYEAQGSPKRPHKSKAVLSQTG